MDVNDGDVMHGVAALQSENLKTKGVHARKEKIDKYDGKV